MMWIEVGNQNSRLARATPEESAWLREYLSFSDGKAHFSGGPPKRRMMCPITDTFPSGFMTLLRKAAPAVGFTIQEFDKRSTQLPRDTTADLVWLRDYQLEAVNVACEKESGILHHVTGAGKTEVAVALSMSRPCNWLFLTHRSGLMEQSAERYELRTGLRAGRVGDGKWDLGDGGFVVATFQTLATAVKQGKPRALALLQQAQGLIVDECHILPADSFWKLAMSTPSARYRIGLSGTPLARGDRKSLLSIAALGPVIHRIKPDVLIDAGVLARPHIVAVECKQRSDKSTWQGVYGEAIVRSKKRNAILIEQVKRAEKPCLVFVKEITHGKLLEKELLQAGIQTAFTWGNHSTEHRKRAVRDLVAGRTEALICSVIFQEGTDVPELRSVVIGSGGKSVIAALQRIGRGMRMSKGKTTFEVYDIADKSCGCVEVAKSMGSGTIGSHNGCRWLEKHTKARLRAYAAEGHSTTLEKWVDKVGRVSQPPPSS